MALKPLAIITLDQLRTWCKIEAQPTAAVSALTSVGTTATAVVAGHGFSSGDTVIVAGATPIAYNGSYVIAVVDANTFTYTFAGGSSPASGTITAQGQDRRSDAILEIEGNAASDYVEAETGRLYRQRTITHTFNGDGRRMAYLPYAPVISITSLALDGTAIDPSEYVLHAAIGKVELKTRTFTPGVGNWTCVHEAGYTELPAQVVAATLDLARSAFDEWNVGAISASSISIGPANTVIRPGFNPRIDKFLKSIKDVRG